MSILRPALVGCIAIAGLLPGQAPASDSRYGGLVRIVTAIQDADYRADLQGLSALRGAIEEYARDPQLRRAATYWRAFATWRRAINAANDPGMRDAVVADFRQCAEEFRTALATDTSWVESKIGLASCLSSSGFFVQGDTGVRNRLFRESLRLAAEVALIEPLNPRLTFLEAGRLYWTPSAVGGSRSLAIAVLERRLETLPRTAMSDPLLPTWGEPELHMQLAFFKLGSPPHDLAGARAHAEKALLLRPQWYYVKNILIPQIDSATVRR